MSKKYALLFSAFCMVWCACHNKQRKTVVQDTTINHQTSFNNRFIDSASIDNFLSRNDTFKNYRDQYFDFYKQRNYEYAWFDSAGITNEVHNFINLLNASISDLEDSSLYNPGLYGLVSKLSGSNAGDYTDSIPEAELSLTGQFFMYAAKVYKGTDADISQLGWFIPRKKINLAALLDSVIAAHATATDQFAPLNSQYKKLVTFLSRYSDMEKDYPADTIAYPAKPVHKGEKSPVIEGIKQRLFVLGDLDYNDSTSTFDTALLRATKIFQRRMGLGVDGVIGAKMIAELNVPIAQRVQQILINLERLRWMPPDVDTNYVFVNIPEYRLYVYDSGRLQFTMNVIVGSAANNTVIFNGNLKYIVFAPYWNVPESIVQKEIVPSMKKDPNYLTKNNMEITGHSHGLPIVRQKPGGNNSLGLVKFLFPNNYNIYFHDTPNRELFDASNRNLSHGCIRLGEPMKFAEYLLRNDTTTYPEHKIDSLMHGTKEYWVTLPKPLPVFIGYFTAFVDRNGVLNFRRDIYKHDEEMAAKLFTK
ncbi:MAG TPA: L,D-transpeptidase family protein [Chitinophagaceae bacterium]|nr:L,D-transpeptidase family protein [Chitinophagaceae bacterium]